MGKPNETPHLSVFDTFKTKTGRLTGEATRQRDIISVLAANGNPNENTRTAIAQKMAKKYNVPWKNIYSGIFRDLDETFIPLGLVHEEGRLPLKRGPKALQERGIPYYRLTERGMIVALSFDSGRGAQLLKSLGSFSPDSELAVVAELHEMVPMLVHTVFENYVRGYCEGRIKDLIPFSSDNIRSAQDESLVIYKEMLAALVKLSRPNRAKLYGFLERVS